MAIVISQMSAFVMSDGPDQTAVIVLRNKIALGHVQLQLVVSALIQKTALKGYVKYKIILQSLQNIKNELH